MRLKFTFFLFAGLIVSVHFSQGQGVENDLYTVSLNLSIDDPGIRDGFVILENTNDGSIDNQYVYWNDGGNPVLQLRDTVGVNIWFCVFGHAPLLVNVEDAEVSADGKRDLTVEPVKDAVYVEKVVWSGYPIEVDHGHHGYNLPPRVSEAYSRLNFRSTYHKFHTDPLVRPTIAHILPFYDFLPVLDRGENLELLLHVNGAKKIVNVEGRSKQLPARKLNRIVRHLQHMRGRKIPRHLIDHKNDYTYSVTIENAIEYSPAQKRRSFFVIRD
jgi:hypothetical protein